MEDIPTRDTADGERFDLAVVLKGEAQAPQTILSVYDILSSFDNLSEHHRLRITERLAKPATISKCIFLENLSLEIRNYIYGYLLLNP